VSASRARRTRVVVETIARFESEQRPVVAVKIGGSLLNLPGLIERIEWLLEQRADARPLLICGGGAAADMVRQWQQMHGLSDLQAHELALAAMAFNELLLQAALPDSRLVADLLELEEAWEQQQRPILQTQAFINEMQPLVEESLPASWEVTGDSIAAWCGELAGASELILAKSTDLPEHGTLDSARAAGLVDEAFGHHRRPEHLAWVNLRSLQPVLSEWASTPAGG
jgi:5-(aminomethyl)-3-furanmethanol phosphate kinase